METKYIIRYDNLIHAGYFTTKKNYESLFSNTELYTCFSRCKLLDIIKYFEEHHPDCEYEVYTTGMC